jgi:hypothetical protein
MATQTAEDAVKAKQQFLSNMSHDDPYPYECDHRVYKSFAEDGCIRQTERIFNSDKK